MKNDDTTFPLKMTRCATPGCESARAVPAQIGTGSGRSFHAHAEIEVPIYGYRCEECDRVLTDKEIDACERFESGPSVPIEVE